MAVLASTKIKQSVLKSLYLKDQNRSFFRAAKEVKKTQKATKKPAAAAAKAKTVKPATKSTKNVQKAAPRVGGKR